MTSTTVKIQLKAYLIFLSLIMLNFISANNNLSSIENKDMNKFKKDWFNYFNANLPEMAERLNNRSALSDEDKAQLAEHLDKFKISFFG